MNDFEGISQETVDSIRADIESTQKQQEDETLEAVGVSPDQPIEETAPAAAPQQEAPQAAPQEREAGQDGSVRDLSGAVKFIQDLPAGIVGRTLDVVDNVFQGDQESYEDIRARMKEGEEALPRLTALPTPSPMRWTRLRVRLRVPCLVDVLTPLRTPLALLRSLATLLAWVPPRCSPLWSRSTPPTTP